MAGENEEKTTKKIKRLLSKGHVLEPDEATAFRALNARGNYLAAGRPDIGYSPKELCREFAQPNRNSFMKLKRMARYLSSHKRLVYKYAWGDPQTVHSPSDEIFDLYVDGDVAGCGQTRRSTSGAIIMYNGQSVKHYSVTQSTLCISCGQAETGNLYLYPLCFKDYGVIDDRICGTTYANIHHYGIHNSAAPPLWWRRPKAAWMEVDGVIYSTAYPCHIWHHKLF